ncbi:uncharacterized protein METZ01_LOCUS276366 [marine metagenome]|uniref:Uncharacterized protein n=1 Tax=marine metagenome TaxID=408172 RepID=A0A382KJJ6_9ZZZZ|tara:strand:- start:128 stop:415 length:288 start_codon:yes stop_codon:yes gene_type:complete
MKLNRRQFTKAAGTGSIALAIAWQQACSEMAESGEVSAETVEVLLDSQGPRGIYQEVEEFERLRRAVGSMIRTQANLRNFTISDDEQPSTVFWRG